MTIIPFLGGSASIGVASGFSAEADLYLNDIAGNAQLFYLYTINAGGNASTSLARAGFYVQGPPTDLTGSIIYHHSITGTATAFSSTTYLQGYIDRRGRDG